MAIYGLIIAAVVLGGWGLVMVLTFIFRDRMPDHMLFVLGALLCCIVLPVFLAIVIEHHLHLHEQDGSGPTPKSSTTLSTTLILPLHERDEDERAPASSATPRKALGPTWSIRNDAPLVPPPSETVISEASESAVPRKASPL